LRHPQTGDAKRHLVGVKLKGRHYLPLLALVAMLVAVRWAGHGGL